MKRTFSEEEVRRLAKDSYEHGDAKFSIRSESCALLVIDMQDEWVKPHFSPYWIPEAINYVPKIRRLMEFCRKKSIPVIFTVYSRTHKYLDRPKSGSLMPNRLKNLEYDQSNLFVEGNIWHELAPLEDEIVIHKPSYGAFYDTPLETILKNLEIDTIIITGAITNLCCDTTARQAYERSFNVVFGSDLTCTDYPELQEHELKIMRNGFARVMSCDEIIKELDK